MRTQHVIGGVALSLALVACDGGQVCDPAQPDTICTIAGTGVQGSDPSARLATEADLYIPFDVAMSPDGELWVMDWNNYLVRAIDRAGVMRTVVGSGVLGDSPTAGVERVPALEAQLNHLGDLVFHGDHAYLAAWHNSRIKRVRLSDMTLENVAGRGVRTEYDGDGGPAIDAALDLPASLAVRPDDGALVVMDQGNQVIRAIAADGTIETIAGACIAEAFPLQCAADQLRACPGSQRLVCSTDEYACERPCCPAYAGDGGAALDARLAMPFGAVAEPGGKVAFDREGNLLFADTDNHRIRKIDRAGVITTIAGASLPDPDLAGFVRGGYSGDGGPAIAAELNHPRDLAIADDGTIYVTDVHNNCIRKIDPAGIISTAVGRCGPERGFAGDGGSPADALLDRPYGIELVGDQLYIADSFNDRVRVANLARAR